MSKECKMDAEEQRLCQIMADCLKKHFSLYEQYKKTQWLTVLQDDYTFVTYNPSNIWPPIKDTVFGLQIDGKTGYLVELRLHPNLRGKGHRRELITAVEEFFRQTKCEKIVLSAAGELPGFYEHFGFKRINVIEFEKEL